MSAAPRIAIVGAGVGGLAAAHRLRERATAGAGPCEVVVLEAADRPGGVVGSERHEGALLERGPDSVVTHKPAALELCRRLDLGDRLVELPAGHAEILHRGRLVPVPDGFALLAPSRRLPVLRSPLLGWRGKWRALVEERHPPTSTDGDESVATFVRRRFGAELLERIVEPIVGAIYMADVERLSLESTFPRFRAFEREHGSVGRGLRAARAAAARSAAPAVATLAGGIGSLVEALVARLPAGALRLGTRVERLRRTEIGYLLDLAGGDALAADAVLVAVPAPAAATLLAGLDPELATAMATIGYASCATIHVGWPRRALRRPPRSHGFFVPRSAGLELVAGSFVDVKLPERVPNGWTVVRVFLGGALAPQSTERSDVEIVEIATRTLAPLVGASEPPSWWRIHRHRGALPQLAIAHRELAVRIDALAAAHPGLALAGGPLGAYGLPDTIAAAEAAATRLVERWEARVCA